MHQQKIFRPGDGPDYPAFAPLIALWEAKRGARSMPQRHEISPRDMLHQLPFIQLYEVLGKGEDFLIRLMGSDFFITMGYDATGQHLSELKDPILRERTRAALRLVFESAVPVRTSSAAEAKAAMEFKLVEKVFLPLGEGETVTHIISQVEHVGKTRAARH